MRNINERLLIRSQYSIFISGDKNKGCQTTLPKETCLHMCAIKIKGIIKKCRYNFSIHHHCNDFVFTLGNNGIAITEKYLKCCHECKEVLISVLESFDLVKD